MGCLYKLSSPSGKSYIGISSKTAEKRWAKHVEHALGKRESGALYNALRKYGPDSFSVQTLAIAKFDYLRELEKRAIRSFGTLYPNGYNVALGGEGWIGPRNEEFRKQVSRAQKIRFQDPEQRALALKALQLAAEVNRLKYYGKPRWKKKSLGLSKEEKSARIRAALARPEVAEKVRACAIARAANPEWRKKLSVQRKGYKYPPCTEDGRRNHLEGAKRMWARRKAKNVT